MTIIPYNQGDGGARASERVENGGPVHIPAVQVVHKQDAVVDLQLALQS